MSRVYVDVDYPSKCSDEGAGYLKLKGYAPLMQYALSVYLLSLWFANDEIGGLERKGPLRHHRLDSGCRQKERANQNQQPYALDRVQLSDRPQRGQKRA